MAYYHVSPKVNRQSITLQGIDPLFSKGVLERCWFCKWDKLEWAIFHTADSYGISVADLDVWSVTFKNAVAMRKAGYAGVYSSVAVNWPQIAPQSATALLDILQSGLGLPHGSA